VKITNSARVILLSRDRRILLNKLNGMTPCAGILGIDEQRLFMVAESLETLWHEVIMAVRVPKPGRKPNPGMQERRARAHFRTSIG
jgi:hypothetical protein